MYINDDEDIEDTHAGKQRAEQEDDERCPKRVKVEVHRVDDPSPCKAVVHLHKNDNNKAEVNEGHAMDESEEKSENNVEGSGNEVTKVEVSGDEVKDEDKKTDTVEDKEEINNSKEDKGNIETVSKDSENKNQGIESSQSDSQEYEETITVVEIPESDV